MSFQDIFQNQACQPIVSTEPPDLPRKSLSSISAMEQFPEKAAGLLAGTHIMGGSLSFSSLVVSALSFSTWIQCWRPCALYARRCNSQILSWTHRSTRGARGHRNRNVDILASHTSCKRKLDERLNNAIVWQRPTSPESPTRTRNYQKCPLYGIRTDVYHVCHRPPVFRALWNSSTPLSRE